MKKLIIMAIGLLLLSACKNEAVFEISWKQTDDRIWTGEEFWANRLQDWQVANGRLECIAANPNLKMRTNHLINLRLTNTEADFTIKVLTGALQPGQNADAASGILIGAGPELDVWGASLVQQKTGHGAGLFAGINTKGEIFLRDMETGDDILTEPSEIDPLKENELIVTYSATKKQLSINCNNNHLNYSEINPARLTGNIALVSHPGTGEMPGIFWFNDLKISGSKFEMTGEQAGPIVSTQYTVSEKIMKLTAFITPIGDNDPRQVHLEVQENGVWTEKASTEISTLGYTATFRIENWDDTRDTPFRVKYTWDPIKDTPETHYYDGIIRRNPMDKDEIVVAGFTGNHNVNNPGLSDGGTFEFNRNGIWYPHLDITRNVAIHNPDMLFFSGDQIYEGQSPTYPDTENYELDYLYKWYLFCIAFRDLTREIPTITIPDDHDVYQGNLWGQSGRATDKDDKGGYVHPAWFVKMTEQIQCSNLPDPYDATPIDQGIGVYYTALNWGGVGFAILEDRKFKSGCADNPFITKGRPDHVIDPLFDVGKIDLPGKELLGQRQLDFLDHWVGNWNSQYMKVALSQTIFANMATHHGGELFRLMADLDSNGWPQTGRNKAIDALRKGFVFHLAGDQHLASIVHHGVDTWDDGIYSFCVPSIANFYPRAWWPEREGKNRSEGSDPNMGRHIDGLGNYVTVYGVTNPSGFTGVSTGIQPIALNDRMPGYGIVKLNKPARTITMECWPRYADANNPALQYPGWPKTISQFDNYGREAATHLPELVFEGIADPVVEIKDELTGERVYCVRVAGNRFLPKVFAQSTYRIIVTNPESGEVKTISGVASRISDDETMDVIF